MELLDFCVSWNEKTKFNNVDFLPKSIRGLLIGASDSGKTTLLFKLLLGTDILDYNNLFIFSKSLNQKEYELLIEGFKHHLTKEMIRGMFDNQKEFKDTSISDICYGVEQGLTDKEKGDIKVSAFGNNSNVPDPSLLDSKKKNLMIFDDVLLEKQRIIE